LIESKYVFFSAKELLCKTVIIVKASMTTSNFFIMLILDACNKTYPH